MPLGSTDFRFFVDLDGVVADWLGRAIKSFGINTRNPTIREIFSTDVRGLEQVIDDKFMWKVIDEGEEAWWHEIEKLPWATYLVDELQKLSPGNLFFLTQPSKHGTSAHGKSDWIRKHFDTDQFLLGSPKHACASRYSFLIDDSPWKIEAFNAAGGHGILFPNAFKMMLVDEEASPEAAWLARRVRGIIEINKLLKTINEIMKGIRDGDHLLQHHRTPLGE